MTVIPRGKFERCNFPPERCCRETRPGQCLPEGSPRPARHESSQPLGKNMTGSGSSVGSRALNSRPGLAVLLTSCGLLSLPITREDSGHVFIFITHVHPQMLDSHQETPSATFPACGLGHPWRNHCFSQDRTRRGMKAGVIFPCGPGGACAGNFD